MHACVCGSYAFVHFSESMRSWLNDFHIQCERSVSVQRRCQIVKKETRDFLQHKFMVLVQNTDVQETPGFNERFASHVTCRHFIFTSVC